jgi:DNA-binding NarL/FixJ family response regulator
LLLIAGAAAAPKLSANCELILEMERKEKNAVRRDVKRVLIVDDHPVFREGLARVLARESDLTVVGEASSARQAMELVGKVKPDAALLDLSLPDKSGLELVKDLRVLYPSLAILIISMHDETVYAERLLRAGADGYVMKEEGPDKILDAVRQVLRRQTWVSPRMSARLLSSFSGNRKKSDSPIARLTDREFEILRLIGGGHDSHSIARQLNISPKTVDTHRSHIKEKLHLTTGMELICYAVRWVQTQPAVPGPDLRE